MPYHLPELAAMHRDWIRSCIDAEVALLAECNDESLSFGVFKGRKGKSMLHGIHPDHVRVFAREYHEHKIAKLQDQLKQTEEPNA